MHHRQKLQDHEIKEAQRLWQMGWSAARIASHYDVTNQCIYYHCRLIERFKRDQLLNLVEVIA